MRLFRFLDSEINSSVEAQLSVNGGRPVGRIDGVLKVAFEILISLKLGMQAVHHALERIAAGEIVIPSPEPRIRENVQSAQNFSSVLRRVGKHPIRPVREEVGVHSFNFIVG